MKAASRVEDMQELNAVIAVRSMRNGAGLTGLPQPDERQQADTSLTEARRLIRLIGTESPRTDHRKTGAAARRTKVTCPLDAWNEFALYGYTLCVNISLQVRHLLRFPRTPQLIKLCIPPSAGTANWSP